MQSSEIEFKYSSKASEYYRALLRHEAYGEELNVEKPDMIEGIEVVKEVSNKVNTPISNANYISNDKQFQEKEAEEEPKKSGFFGKLGNAMKSGLQSAKSKAEIVGGKIKDLGIKDKTISLGKKAVNGTKQVYNSEFVQGTISKTEKGFKKFSNAIDNFVNHEILGREVQDEFVDEPENNIPKVNDENAESAENAKNAENADNINKLSNDDIKAEKDKSNSSDDFKGEGDCNSTQ